MDLPGTQKDEEMCLCSREAHWPFSFAQGEIAALAAVVLFGEFSVWVRFGFANILRFKHDTIAIFLSLSCPQLLPVRAPGRPRVGLSSRTALFRGISAPGKLKVRDLLRRPRLRNE